eukprot:Skav223712  [mRNA]  locus=scaffold2564:49229:50704:- [translate_table: standard]
MRLGVATAILLVLGASALRDEIDRLALQVGENEHISNQEEASHGSSQLEEQQPVAQPFSPTAAEALIDLPVDPTDASESTVLGDGSCRDGVLRVKGSMVVKEELVFSEDFGRCFALFAS